MKKSKTKFLNLLAGVMNVLLAAAFVFEVVLLGTNVFVNASAAPHILTPEEASEAGGIDCIIILGAGVRSDGSPSPILCDRLDVGVSLYKSGTAKKLLVSGDHGHVDYDEVNVMKKYATALGVPSSDVFMDHAGFSTYETMYRAKEVFQAKRVIIVTQSYHLSRAVYIANALGLEAFGVASDLRNYHYQPLYDVREIFARTKDFLYTLARPAPTYLGDKIPISGDGDATNDKSR